MSKSSTLPRKGKRSFEILIIIAWRRNRKAIVCTGQPRRLHIQGATAAATTWQAEWEGKLRQFHCAVNNDISEGTDEISDPLWIVATIERVVERLSLSVLYLPFRSLLYVYQPMDLNLPVLFNRILFNGIFLYFCCCGKIN